MHTDSSARRTYLASVSASECTATVLTPSSRQARSTRSAISPRLAMRIFSNMTGSADDEQRLAVFDRLAVLDHDGLDHAADVGLDLVHQLHRFDDAQALARGDALTELDEGLGARRRGAVEGANHRRLDHMPGWQGVD